MLYYVYYVDRLSTKKEACRFEQNYSLTPLNGLFIYLFCLFIL